MSSITILRVAVFKDGWEPSNVDTHTYLFPAEIIRQTGEGWPTNWGEREGKPEPADYAMDARSAATEADSDALKTALRALPSLSLVLAPEDLFGAERGLYAYP